MQAATLKGAGLGLRTPHLRQIIARPPAVNWFEVHICNFIGSKLNQALLHKVREAHALSFHSVSMNLGGSDPLDLDYFKSLKLLCERFEPALVSDHLCFTQHNGKHFHDLLPLPRTMTTVEHVSERIQRVQDILGRQLVVENVSRYYSYPENHMQEGEFVREICARSGCGILLDLNNAYVNAINEGDDIQELLQNIPSDNITEVHLGGHSIDQHAGQHTLIDTHGAAISDEVWALYTEFCIKHAHIPCLIEWDTALPSFETLLEEHKRAQSIINNSAKKIRLNDDKSQRFANYQKVI